MRHVGSALLHGGNLMLHVFEFGHSNTTEMS